MGLWSPRPPSSPPALSTGRKTLRVEELPPAVRRLRPYEIEDFLCIYKRELEKLALAEDWRPASPR